MSKKFRCLGLNEQEVHNSRQRYGANVLTPPVKAPVWKMFLVKFTDPLIVILLIAGFLSVFISFYEYIVVGEPLSVFFEPLGIYIAIFLATGLSFYFELKADGEFALLNKVNDDETYQVVRDGNVVKVARRDIVVGDIVLISVGDEICADGELLEAVSLHVDESSLTGEPICLKSVNPDEFRPDDTYPTNVVLKGTKVMEGHGLMRVTKVGDQTENGKVFVSSQIDNSVKTPLNEQLDRLGMLISKASYLVGVIIVLGRIFFYLMHVSTFDIYGFIAYMLQTIMIAVTLVVCSVPEGLPMAVTLSLAFSMRKMLRTNNLVRKMHACETMGATTVICTDKTGTLTQNQMRVADSKFITSDDVLKQSLYEGIAVNSTAVIDLTSMLPQVLGNPTEGALLLWLHEQNIDSQHLKDIAEVECQIPFSGERKYMATQVRSSVFPGKSILYVKGAPEILLRMCSRIEGNVEESYFEDLLRQYQRKGFRTLGFAYQVVEDGQHVFDGNTLIANRLIFSGVVAISDPVRVDVPKAVDECMKAGIALKIVTGDNPVTAKEIARQIGLWTDRDNDDSIITGPEFAALDEENLLRRIDEIKIIARARPMDKKRLVETLQKVGHVVAVTGDGTNDAPALKAAHVGLSMGDGTSVAKEASDITIIDNSFSSIGKAVMWGRSLYQNLQRFIMFQMTVNVVACLTVMVGAFMDMESPLTVTQMLWVNLIMDTFAAIALSILPPSENVMNDPPRDRKAFIINNYMIWNIVGVGILFFVVLFALLHAFNYLDVKSLMDLLHCKLGANNGLSPYEHSLFFTTFVMLQFWNMFNARAFETGRSAFHFRGCKSFVLIAATILIGQILIVELGGQMFNVVPLKLSDWLIIVAATSLVLWVGEVIRLIIGKLQKDKPVKTI